MSQLPQLFCKLTCFNAVKQHKLNVCKCFPFCSLLNRTATNKSPAYMVGISVTDKKNDCDCTVTCKHTSSSMKDMNDFCNGSSKTT